MPRKVYYISDGTGITAENFGNSLLTQFPDILFKSQTLPFINTVKKAKRVIDKISKDSDKKSIIFYTIVADDIAVIIKNSDAISYPLFEHFIQPLEIELGVKSSHQMGRQHAMGKAVHYKNRLDAINYTLNNDDGMNIKNYDEADIILLGASRCGKTPTCLYLAMNFNIKAANYPIVEGDIDLHALPTALKPWKNKCYGLTIDPIQLSKIRQERMPNSHYAELRQCKYEVTQIEHMYFNEQLPSINTSTISIEEISTQIINQTHLKR